MIGECERSCHGDCLCKAKIVKQKQKQNTKNPRQIKIKGGNFSMYVKRVRNHERKDANLDLSSPINRNS